jgi:hypothetical protein
MMLFLILQAVAALATLRPDAPPLDLNVARAMTPIALGDALLAPGHRPIVEVVVHPAGMEAPASWVTKVELLAQSQMSPESGFCSTTLYTVTFGPPASSNWRATSTNPVRPAGLEAQTLYRLRNVTPPAGSNGCNGPMHDYFHVDPSLNGREFELVRLLAQAQKAAKSGDALPFDLSFQDKMADDFESLARSHPDIDTRRRFARILNGRGALSAIPLEEIAYIAFDPVITPSRPSGDCSQRVCTAELVVGEDWRAEVTFTAHQIVRLHITRAIPAPF